MVNSFRTLGVCLLSSFLTYCSDDSFTGSSSEKKDQTNAHHLNQGNSVNQNQAANDRQSADQSTQPGVRPQGLRNQLGEGEQCRFFQKNHLGKERFSLPLPNISDKRLLGGASVPSPHLIALLGSGPKIDINEFTLANRGQFINNDTYAFSFEASASLKSVLGGGWQVGHGGGGGLLHTTFRVVIENAKAKGCQARGEAVDVTRDMVIGDPRGCFDSDTRITMANGQRRKIALIFAGEKVLNPITGKAQVVKEVIYGPEKHHGMIEVGTGKNWVLVTKKHPFMTKTGLKQARELTKADSIWIAGENQFRKIHRLLQRAPDRSQFVYNLRLESTTGAEKDHMVLADGVVSGDLYLQRQLEITREESKLVLNHR